VGRFPCVRAQSAARSEGTALAIAVADSGLFEREREQRALAGLIEAAREGRGGLALLDAAPGLGKTALCAFARSLAERREMTVLSATAAPLDREFPFGLARKLFDHRVERAGASDRRALLSGAARLAAPLFGIGDGVPSPEPSGESSIVYGLYWLAVACSEERPLLLVADDIHWADASSLRTLLYVAERLDGLPIALLAAIRDREPGSDESLLAQIRAAAGRERTLSPRPLSERAVSDLIQAISPAADQALCAACAEATAGNPFLLIELLRRLRSEGLDPPGEQAREAVARLTPQILSGASLERLALLPESALAVAQALAVLDEDADLRRAAILANLDLVIAARATDSLAAAEIVAYKEHVCFEQPLVRSAVYEQLPAGERRFLHARAARILDEDGAAAERIAAQLLHACPAGEQWAVDRLVEAAHSARSRGSHAIAVQLLERALAEPAPAGARGGLTHELGLAQLAAEDSRAVETLSEASELLHRRDAQAQALADLGRARFVAGDLAGATDCYARAIERLGDPASPLGRELEARYVAAATGTQAVTAEDRERMDRLLDPHLHGDVPAERAVLATVALRGALLGEESSTVRERALRALEGDAVAVAVASEPIDLVAAAIALVYVDELDGCRKALDEALAYAQQAGAVDVFRAASGLRAWTLYFSGALQDAIADAEQALAGAGERTYQPVGATYTILLHAQIEIGDFDGAQRSLEAAEARAHAEQGGEYVIPHAARGRLKLALGDAAGALEDLETQGRLLAQLGYATYPIPWRPTAALAELALGDRAKARAFAAESLELAERVGAARGIGVALRAAGLVEGGADGIELLTRAVSTLERSPARLELARSLVDLGALLRRTGLRERAREPLRKGLDLAHHFGATPLADLALDELRATGARPRRIQRSGLDSLTASERRIAAMAAEGMSNPQIAQALFVTRKTVEFHLGNAYSKLGISSRGDLPRALASEE
jgi:DNA-binding CsgD family transcriptional regulator